MFNNSFSKGKTDTASQLLKEYMQTEAGVVID